MSYQCPHWLLCRFIRVPPSRGGVWCHTSALIGCCVGSLGCILAEEVCGAVPVPPFPASVKDGYAVLGKCFLAQHTKFTNCFIASDGAGERGVVAPVTAGEKVSG